MNRLINYFGLLIVLFSYGCTTSNHGTFVNSSYMEPTDKSTRTVAGSVIGESAQTWLLYFIPIGEAPSTDSAITDAKSRIEGTKFLTDLSIDDAMRWKFGYSEQVIRVKATAHK